MHRIPLKIVTRLSVIFTVIGLLLVIIGSEDVLIVVVFLKQVVIDIVHIVVNM